MSPMGSTSGQTVYWMNRTSAIDSHTFAFLGAATYKWLSFTYNNETDI